MKIPGICAAVMAVAVCTTTQAAAHVDSKIAWYGVLSDGLTEARRSGRPILLISAAPNCHGVSGVW